jgi:hypothetical protein
MIFIYFCLILGVIFLISFLTVRVTKGGLPAVCLKTGTSICFLLMSFSALYLMDAPIYGYFIIIGQIFGLIGDIFLDQKYVHPEQDIPYTHMGFTAFGIGHLFFGIALFLTFPFEWIHIAIAGTAALIITVLIYSLQKPMKLDYGKFTIDLVLYTAVIGFITALPATFIIFKGIGVNSISVFLIGMILFLLSDMVLSQIYFGSEKNKAPYVIINLLLYYFAQYVISYSILIGYLSH